MDVLYKKNIYLENSDSSKLNKIMLIPCKETYERYENQSILFFIDNKIKLYKIRDSKYIENKIINLAGNYKEFQFIVYFDFLLILQFDNQSNSWKGKIFSLYFEDKSVFNEIQNTNINIELDKNTKFSMCEISDKNYLLALTYEDNKPKIYYWDINYQISGTFSKRTIGDNGNEIIENNSLGNCIVNHFYLCFYKYPLIGAIEYAFKEYELKKNLKLSFFIENQYNDNIEDLKSYVKKLIEILNLMILILV